MVVADDREVEGSDEAASDSNASGQPLQPRAAKELAGYLAH